MGTVSHGHLGLLLRPVELGFINGQRDGAVLNVLLFDVEAEFESLIVVTLTMDVSELPARIDPCVFKLYRVVLFKYQSGSIHYHGYFRRLLFPVELKGRGQHCGTINFLAVNVIFCGRSSGDIAGFRRNNHLHAITAGIGGIAVIFHGVVRRGNRNTTDGHTAHSGLLLAAGVGGVLKPFQVYDSIGNIQGHDLPVKRHGARIVTYASDRYSVSSLISRPSCPYARKIIGRHILGINVNVLCRAIIGYCIYRDRKPFCVERLGRNLKGHLIRAHAGFARARGNRNGRCTDINVVAVGHNVVGTFF